MLKQIITTEMSYLKSEEKESIGYKIFSGLVAFILVFGVVGGWVYSLYMMIV